MASARFETLNPQTQDLVDCLIPGIVSNWGLENILDAIPEEIRMRKWDCAKKDHILNEAENDARNWGVSFLKDLLTISRLTKGQLEVFQNDLRAGLDKAKGSHSWTRLKDIKELKKKYDGSAAVPSDSDSDVVIGSGALSSDESTTEDDVVEPMSKKRGRPLKKESKSKRKANKRRKEVSPPARLRRSSDISWERRDKSRRHGRDRQSAVYYTPDEPHYYPDERYFPHRRPAIQFGREQSYIGTPGTTMRYPSPFSSGASFATQDNNFSSMPEYGNLTKRQLELQLEVAEAELKAKKLRLAVLSANRRADMDGEGTKTEPHVVDDN
ncbi:hypothetical protein BDV96DRAFT_602333 [Lophiotrema nucula]|uniref:Uncharacterized protein n=1 Tax=Lophiotrema nucula TaxID=690887 RepID=A0A6A5YZX0_9PLEO|nr:hypothetical protein BDV96DRAFT_602333 [Lophiotrema nucula]